jgi:YidC/Oxa1 family membrane protein insertase
MFSFIGQVFTAFITRPIFNLLILILALLPGHNLGVAIIIFTVLVRIALYPLLKKQLHHAMAMRKLQPEMKKIKKEAAGDRQKESQMMMQLYKEREVNPFASIGIILAQLPILIGLYQGLIKLINDPNTLFTFTYSWVQNLPFIESLQGNIDSFDETLLGIVDLTKPALDNGSVYWPAMVIVLTSVVVQYFQSKQLLLTDKNARGLRQIFKDTASGKEVDQSEVQAATSKFTLYFIPAIVFFVSASLASALALYWLVGGLVAWWQQTRILRQDTEEMIATVDKEPAEAEIIAPKKPKKKKSAKKKSNKKRR